MENLLNLLSSEFVAALGWSLLHSLWQGALIALLFGIALLFLQKHSANLRYILAAFGLGLTLMTFFATFAYLYHTAKIQRATLEEQVIIVTEEGYENLMYSATENQTLLNVFLGYFNQHLPVIVVLWCLGVLVLSLRFLGGLAFLQRLKHTKNQPLSENWTAKMMAIAQKIGVKKSVELVESTLIKVPMVVGYLKPVILLPIGTVNALSVAEVEAILAHELAHIRRHDYLINLIQSIIDVLFFYHPAIWWMSSTVRTERENCCDDLALSVTSNSLIIARALANLEALRQNSYQLSLAFTGNKNQLLKRISRLLGQPTKRNNHFIEGFVSIVVVLLCIMTINYKLNASNETNTEFDSIETDTTSTIEEIIVEDEEVLEEYIIIEKEIEHPAVPLPPSPASSAAIFPNLPTIIDWDELKKLENTKFDFSWNIDASGYFFDKNPEIVLHYKEMPKTLELAKAPKILTWVEKDFYLNAPTLPRPNTQIAIVADKADTEDDFNFDFAPFQLAPDGKKYQIEVKVETEQLLKNHNIFKTFAVQPDTSILDGAEILIIDGGKITVIRKKQHTVEADKAIEIKQGIIGHQMEVPKRQVELTRRRTERETDTLQQRVEVKQDQIELEARECEKTQWLEKQLRKDGLLKSNEDIKTINISNDNNRVKIKVNGKKIPNEKAKTYHEMLKNKN